MRGAISVEWLKLRRSVMAWVTAALLGLGVPALTSGFMAAARLGPPDSPLALKINAMLIGEGWSAYLGMLAQILSVAMLMSGIVISWVFGREFTDHTVVSLFALPTSRSTIAAAKFVVLAVWTTALCMVVLVAAFALAPLAGLPIDHLDNTRTAAVKVLVVGITGAMLTTPLALVATVARGYLPAVATLILIVVVTQVITLVGFGAWFPYAAPSIWAGMGGQAAASLIHPYQLALVPVTSAAATAATIWRWQHMQIA
jgi:ABC-2 type transport system permease protein